MSSRRAPRSLFVSPPRNLNPHTRRDHASLPERAVDAREVLEDPSSGWMLEDTDPEIMEVFIEECSRGLPMEFGCKRVSPSEVLLAEHREERVWLRIAAD